MFDAKFILSPQNVSWSTIRMHCNKLQLIVHLMVYEAQLITIITENMPVMSYCKELPSRHANLNLFFFVNLLHSPGD